jgi:hypothetical protein
MPLLRNALCNAPASEYEPARQAPAALFFLSAPHNKNNYSLPASPRNNQSSAREFIHRPYSSAFNFDERKSTRRVKCEINFLRIAQRQFLSDGISHIFSLSERGFRNTPSVPFSIS